MLYHVLHRVQVQNASGSFEYDGEHHWSLKFDAIFDLLPGYNLTGHRLLQRLADNVHPHLGFQVRESHSVTVAGV